MSSIFIHQKRNNYEQWCDRFNLNVFFKIISHTHLEIQPYLKVQFKYNCYKEVHILRKF